jgi:hypothetical protein
VITKHWWEILKRYRSSNRASVLLQLSSEVHNDPIHSHQLVIAFYRMQSKFDLQNAKTLEQKLSEAKATIEKMQSGTERETKIKAFVNYVEGVYKKAIERNTSGGLPKYSMELILPEEEDDILPLCLDPSAFPGRYSAGRQLKDEGEWTKSTLAIVTKNDLRRALDNFLAHRRVKHSKELVHWASAFTMGRIAKGDSQRNVAQISQRICDSS